MIDMKKKAEDILEDYARSYSQVDLETLAKFLDKIKSEAIKEFAERLCDGRLLGDPVLIAVRAELKNTTEPVKIEHNSLCETETYMRELMKE